MFDRYSQPGNRFRNAAPSTTGAAEGKRQPGGAVLIVEDDPGIRNALAELVRECGYTPGCCSNGKQAIDYLAGASAPPEVIILDLMMPVMDGWEFRLQQRADARLAKIPVLAISADGSAKAAAIDADGFLHKPFRAVDVQRELDRILRERDVVEHSQSLMAMGTVVASVAHELKNPLTFVLSNMELANRATSQMVGHLASLRRAAALSGSASAVCTSLEDGLADVNWASQEARLGLDQIITLTRDLGQLGRRQEFRRERLSLKSPIESAIRMTAPQIQRQATLAREYDNDPIVVGDWARLTQVFLNLLVNATQAVSKTSARRGEIRIRMHLAGRDAVTDIEDNGEGITPEMAAQLFKPFVTTKPAGEGSGLGLAISREIVAAHGGTLEFDSRPGRGSRFRVTLPVAPTDTPTPPTYRPTQPRAL